MDTALFTTVLPPTHIPWRTANRKSRETCSAPSRYSFDSMAGSLSLNSDRSTSSPRSSRITSLPRAANSYARIAPAAPLPTITTSPVITRPLARSGLSGSGVG